MKRAALVVLALALILGWDASNRWPLRDHAAAAQVTVPGVPTGTPAALTISSTSVTPATATGGSATLCPNTADGVLLYVATNGVYYSYLAQTPTANTGVANVGSVLFAKPWKTVNLIRQSSDATVNATCFQ